MKSTKSPITQLPILMYKKENSDVLTTSIYTHWCEQLMLMTEVISKDWGEQQMLKDRSSECGIVYRKKPPFLKQRAVALILGLGLYSLKHEWKLFPIHGTWHSQMQEPTIPAAQTLLQVRNSAWNWSFDEANNRSTGIGYSANRNRVGSMLTKNRVHLSKAIDQAWVQGHSQDFCGGWGGGVGSLLVLFCCICDDA
jgi:hypothetical protein